jgi:multidrug resistance efflux pump
MIPVGLVVLAVAAYIGITFYRDGLLYVSTDNAQLTGTPVQVGALAPGRVASLTPRVGAAVHKGDVLAQVELPTQVGTTPTGAPRMEFLDDSDTRVLVTAPIDGVVIAEPGAVGSTVTAGQPIITLVDPTHLWVNANIEETKVARLKVGQEVDVHVDALGTSVPGRVEAITPATAASFSLIPQSNASANYTKVTQLVPVRIAVNLQGQTALLNGSVSVRVHVGE